MTPRSPARARRPRRAPASPGPLGLAGVVAELVDEYRDPADRPAGHRCTKDGPLACSHEQWSTTSLLARVAPLVKPGAGARPEGTRPRGSRGSPAPWAAGPALLVDEVHRGALRFDEQLRAALQLGPLHVHVGWRVAEGWHAPLAHPWRSVTVPAHMAPLDLAGAAALRGLPLLVELLAEKHADHPLVAGPLVDEARPARGRSWGSVERAVRRWHAEAREITGHATRPMIVRERRNPLAGAGLAGPACEDPWLCGHLSCRAIFLAGEPEWSRVECPYCGAAGFPQDPDTGELHCPRPRCRDERGRRPAWSVEAFMRPIAEVVEALEAPPW